MHSKAHKLLAAMIAAAIWTPGTTRAETSPAVPAVHTTAGLKAAPWGKNLTITFGKDAYTLASDRVPNHARPAQYLLPKPGILVPESAADLIAGDDPSRLQNYSFTLPLHPKKNATATPTPLGPIGILVSGAALFNPYDHTIALQPTSRSTAFRSCTRATAMQPRRDSYRRGLTTTVACRTASPMSSTSPASTRSSSASPWTAFPSTARSAKRERNPRSSTTSEPTGEFPQGMSHYHLTEGSPYSIRCLAGRCAGHHRPA